MIPLPVTIFPNKLTFNVPNSILRNLPFCFFASFRIVSLTLFNNRPECSRDLIIFIISSISSFDIISVLAPEPYFLCIPTSAAAAAAVNPNGVKILLDIGLISFFINGKPGFNNGPRSLPRNTPYKDL